jgi:hypothetical protein
MAKKITTGAKLEHYIHEEMKKHKCCDSPVYPSVYWHIDDGDGHNWDVDILSVDPAYEPQCEECDDLIQEAVQALRAQYKLLHHG